MKKLTILSIDKENEWTNKLSSHLPEEEYRLLIGKNKDHILELFYEYNTDIDFFIIAVKYPDYDTSQIVKTVRSYSDVPIFILSENMEEETQIMYYNLGADDFLSYYYSVELLMTKIAVIKKRMRGMNDVIEEGILEINPFRKQIKVEGKDVQITAKEFELLYYLVCNKMVIQTRDQILTAVWGINYMGNDRVVDSLIKKLRNKIGKAASYIKTVYAMGYYFEVS